ncbi:MAG: 16S rRNA (cytosine(1402)-N(4))-methyltransferase RsmH [Desulfobacterales bacterium]|nr:MAG: 16S rRNA (cytosine(1402)-N(4))-methyltransferase RsmH [Desulfobacterales bacterium]
MAYRHIPAMPTEVAYYLDCQPGKIYVDGTLGGSGHARAICEKILPDGLLVGIDQDIDAITNAQKVLQAYASNVRLFHGNFVQLPDFLTQLKIAAVDGMLLDLGLSLHQLENSGRGFSFRKDEPLDMRMDVDTPETAGDLINRAPEDTLRKIIKQYGEERWANQIAHNIVSVRKQTAIRTSRQLAEIVAGSIPARAISDQHIHPATRVFMALRIAVNQELDKLEAFLEFAVDLLKPDGRLCVLSFHSLEDRIVKQRFKALAQGCLCPPKLPQCVCGQKSRIRLLTKKVVRPAAAEIAANPMARSTRLRAIAKL